MSNIKFDLGKASSKYNVSGSQRFKYFSTAKSLSNLGSSYILSHSEQQYEQQKGGKDETKQQLIQSDIQKHAPQQNINVTSKVSEKEFKDDGTQTENYINHLTDCEKQRLKELIQERDAKKRIEMEREKRKSERKAQEEALPPLKDAKAIRVYRRFLEENERKDFELREKELDDEIERKLQKIQYNLKRRFSNNSYTEGTIKMKENQGMKKVDGIGGMKSSIISEEKEKESTRLLLERQVTRDTEVERNDHCRKQVPNRNSMPALKSLRGPMERCNGIHARQVTTSINKRETSKRKKQSHVKSLEIVQSSFPNVK